MEKYDGGPAFPAEGGCDSGLHANPGMSLRDYFAAHAPEAPSDKDLKKIFSGFPEPDYSGYFNGVPNSSIRKLDAEKERLWLQGARIRWRWFYADEMIEARNA